jgi:predicted acyl esterase
MMRNNRVPRPLALAAALLLSTALAQKPDILERIGIHTGYTVDREIMVPMRDGVRLSTAVLRPEKVAERMPVILIRTPYLKDEELLGLKDFVSFLLQHVGAPECLVQILTGW